MTFRVDLISCTMFLASCFWLMCFSESKSALSSPLTPGAARTTRPLGSFVEAEELFSPAPFA